MPWFYRRNYYRRRPLWRRRFRRPLRRRLWRRKKKYRYRQRPRVRRKLKSLILKEYQPRYIKKLKISGEIPLFMTTNERTTNNMSMYWYETAPHLFPGGGGWSCICFNLKAFYQLFEKVLCYWSTSNNEHPLIRYTGCRIKLFAAEKTDYITTYNNCLPMKPNLQTYTSSHPYIQQLHKHHKIVHCKQNSYRKKPYQILKIKPPTQLKNKWYFQTELADVPLCMLLTSAMSLDRMYLASTSQSTSIGFTSLNTDFFHWHNFKLHSTQGYMPNNNRYIWATKNGKIDIKNEKVINLIYLGMTKNITKGKTILETRLSGEDLNTTWSRYTASETDWGNVFEPIYLKQESTVYYTNYSFTQLKSMWGNITESTLVGDNKFYLPTKPLLTECRYNPYSDNGNNHVFLNSIAQVTQKDWEIPQDTKLNGPEYPLWLSLWGFLDWERNVIGIPTDTDYVCVLVSDHISPKQPFYIPLDEDFLNGRSPFQPANTLPFDSDRLHWHPKVRFQTRSINIIGSSGPATVKLPKQISTEAHCKFDFYFKIGGCAGTSNTIEDPTKQPIWPTPDNLLQRPSLQSPTYPIEQFLYSFDTRRQYLTSRAIERLLQYEPTKESVSQITERNLLQEAPQETSQITEEKTEKETLLKLINQQYKQQQQLQQRILQLMELQNLE
nr:MAG: ORF1 [TTV-like mini virus]UGV42434.1 MAG: ORF1 [TTV-like mini virus]